MEAHCNSCCWKASCQLSKSWLSRSWPKGPQCQLVWGGDTDEAGDDRVCQWGSFWGWTEWGLCVWPQWYSPFVMIWWWWLFSSSCLGGLAILVVQVAGCSYHRCVGQCGGNGDLEEITLFWQGCSGWLMLTDFDPHEKVKQIYVNNVLRWCTTQIL